MEECVLRDPEPYRGGCGSWVHSLHCNSPAVLRPSSTQSSFL